MMSRMGSIRHAIAVVVVVSLSACSGSESATAARPHGPLRVRATGLLIRDPLGVTKQTQICVGAVNLTRPPRECGGLIVRGVDIDELRWMDRRDGVVYGGAEIVGTLRHRTITATEPVRRSHRRRYRPPPRPPSVFDHRGSSTLPPQSVHEVDAYARRVYPNEYSGYWSGFRGHRRPYGFVGSTRRLRTIGRDLAAAFPESRFYIAKLRHRTAEYEAAMKKLSDAYPELRQRGIFVSEGGASIDSADAQVEVASRATLRYLRKRFGPLITFTSIVEVLDGR